MRWPKSKPHLTKKQTMSDFQYQLTMKLWDDPKVNKIWLKKQTKSDFQFQLTMKSCDDQKVNYIRLKSELHMIFSSNSVIMGWLKITWFHSKLELKIRHSFLFSQMLFTFLCSHSFNVNWNSKSDLVCFLVKCSLLFDPLIVSLLIGNVN